MKKDYSNNYFFIIHGLSENSVVFGPRYSPYSYYQCRTSDRAAVGTTLYVFSYDNTTFMIFNVIIPLSQRYSCITLNFISPLFYHRTELIPDHRVGPYTGEVSG